MGISINWIYGLILFLTSHPLHLSFTNIEYSDSKNIWEITVKLFKDDFTDELKNLYGVDINLETDNFSTEQEAYFHTFISDHFKLQFDKDTIYVDSWKFTGVKQNFEAIWLNYSFHSPGQPSEVYIENTLMFNMFQDQKNLLIFSDGINQKSFQFKKNNSQIHFKLEK